MGVVGKFKIGDRVSVVGPVIRADGNAFGSATDKRSGVIDSCHEVDPTVYKFKDEHDGCIYSVTERQCRRLVKKKLRRFWLERKLDSSTFRISDAEPLSKYWRYSEIIEVVEIRKRSK